MPPREIQTAVLKFHSTGAVVNTAPDEIAMTAYRRLENVVADIEGAISVRRGMRPLTTGLPKNPYWFGYLHDDTGTPWRYTVAGRQWYVATAGEPGLGGFPYLPIEGGDGLANPATLPSPQVDHRPYHSVYTLDGIERKAHIFLADGARFLKHPGGQSTPARQVGIDRPALPIAQAIVISPGGSGAIDTTLAAYAGTGNDGESVAGKIYKGVNGTSIPFSELDLNYQVVFTGEPLTGTSIHAAAGATGTLEKTTGNDAGGEWPDAKDLGTDDLDEAITLLIKFPTADDARFTDQILLSFSLAEDPTTAATSREGPFFTTMWQYEITPSTFESPSQSQSRYKDSDDSEIPSLKERIEKNKSSTSAPPGPGVWHPLSIPKSKFQRVGRALNTLPRTDWNAVNGVRVTLKAKSAGAANIQVRNINSNHGGHLAGGDYTWTFTFFDALAGQESDFATPIEAPATGPNNERVQLIFPANRLTNPPLPNPNKIRIYRQGGSNIDYQLVAEIPYVPGQKFSYVDDIPDSALGIIMATDNQIAPYKHANLFWRDVEGYDSDASYATWIAGAITHAPRGVEMHNNRLWIWGCPGDSPNLLRFSKVLQVESFPTAFYLQVGAGSDQIVRVLEFSGELFVFTRAQVYRVVGNDEASYAVVDTPVLRGAMNGHAIARGDNSLFMLSTDGIYDIPGGKRLSAPIDPVFRGAPAFLGGGGDEDLFAIPPVAPAIFFGRGQEAMVVHQNRLYFSYMAASRADPSARFETVFGFDSAPQGAPVNDSLLIYDPIGERWSYYSYGSNALFVEPRSIYEGLIPDCLIGSPYPQNTMGTAATAGNMGCAHRAMVLEYDFWDATEPSVGIQWQIITRDFDMGMPENEKRIIDFVLDLESRNDPVTISAILDDSQPYFIDTVATPSRQQVVLPIPSRYLGEFFAKRLRLCLSGRTSVGVEGPRKIYKLMIRHLVEGIAHKSHVTAWDNWGTDTPKLFRNLHISLSTKGRAIDGIDIELDGQFSQTVGAGLVALDTQSFDFGLAVDTRGTLARLKVRTQDPVQILDYRFDVMPEPVNVVTYQSPWDAKNTPFFKHWKNCVIEADTSGTDATVTFWGDGHPSQSWTINAQGRQWLTHSLGRDTFFKEARITISGTARVYSLDYSIEVDPADVTEADSYDFTFAWDRFKVARRVYVSMKNPLAPVTMQIFMDEVLKTTKTIDAFNPPTGYAKRKIDLEGGIRGKLMRIIFTSSAAFQIYPDRTEIHVRNLNAEDGFTKVQLSATQSM